MRQTISPVKPQPTNIVLDRCDVFLAFLAGIRIVKTQVGPPVRLCGHTKIEADRHHMTDMEVAVRLRGKARHYLVVFPGLQVVVDNLADKVPRFGFAH